MMAYIANDITAQIKFTRNYDIQSGKDILTAEWEGPEDGILGISGELMRDADPSILKKPNKDPQAGDTIVISPYELIVIEHQTRPAEIYYCIRKQSRR